MPYSRSLNYLWLGESCCGGVLRSKHQNGTNLLIHVIRLSVRQAVDNAFVGIAKVVLVGSYYS